MARNYYDEIVNFLDEEMDIFDDDLNGAVADITGPGSGTFCCSFCEKTYKTKGGLDRHVNNKHTDPVDDALEATTLLNLIEKSMEALSGDLCFSFERRCSFSSHSYSQDKLPDLLNIINSIYSGLAVNNNLESFYSEYFGLVVFNAPTYFDSLPQRSATLLATKLGENIICYFQKQKACKLDSIPLEVPPITDKEADALQYLSGYVVQKILKKTKNRSNYCNAENQAVITVLQHAITRNTDDQTLVSVQTRGGLTAVTDDCQRIFRRAEEQFRIATSVDFLRKIDTKKITDSLLEDTDVVSLFNSVVDISGVSLIDEIRQNLLQSMIMLYLRVRSFSLAKDITSKKKDTSTSSKALRKAIKKSTE